MGNQQHEQIQRIDWESVDHEMLEKFLQKIQQEKPQENITIENVNNFFNQNQEISELFFSYFKQFVQDAPTCLNFFRMIAGIMNNSPSTKKFFFNHEGANSIECLYKILIWDSQDINHQSITQEKLSDFFRLLFWFYEIENPVLQKQLSKIYCKETAIDFPIFEAILWKEFHNINRSLYWQFEKYLNGQKQGQTNLFKKEDLICQELFVIFTWCDNKFNINQKLTQVFNPKEHGVSFLVFQDRIKNLKAPLFFLMKVEGIEGVLGFCSNFLWEDYLGYQRDLSVFLFQTEPDFKLYFPQAENSQSKVCYMNTKKIQGSNYPRGLGICGDQEYQNFRIWLDWDLTKKSYVQNDKKIFGEFSGFPEQGTQLWITDIQVWTTGDEKALENQNHQKQFQMELQQQQAKMTKKNYLGTAQEVLLEKQFQFKEELNMDFDEEKKLHGIRKKSDLL